MPLNTGNVPHAGGEFVEQATAAPGEKRDVPAYHDHALIDSISTEAHRMTTVLATSVQCSCGWLFSNPDESDLREHVKGNDAAE